MRTELFSAKCPNTIVVQETDQDYQRILFYCKVKAGQPSSASMTYFQPEITTILIFAEKIDSPTPRILHPEEHCVADFWDKASCLDMNELLLIPRTQ
ncbi:hypothetical protein L345_18202, partial [Ophiophagus hannah]